MRSAAMLTTAGLLALALLAPAATHAASSTPAATAVPDAAGEDRPSERAPGADAQDDEPERIRRPSRVRGATVARVVAPTVARRRLKSPRPRTRIGTETAWSGQAQVLLVLGSARRGRRDWVRVLLPNRPNGSAGWVPRDRVALGRTRYWIDVRVRPRVVTVYRDGRRARRFRAVVGAPGTPTPRGLAAVYERNRQPNPRAFLGPWVLSLTSFSNVLENYGGGPGRVGIHGRSGASLRDPLGSARSHGCIRVDNRHVSWMAAHVPPGTPVRTRR